MSEGESPSIRHLSCGCPDCKGHAINADYREMWNEAIRLNQKLCAALSGTTETPKKRSPLTPEEVNQIEERWDAGAHGSKIAFVVREVEAAHKIRA